MEDMKDAPGPGGRRLVNIIQAAEMAGVSRRTVHGWIRTGKLQCIRTAGNRTLIYLDSLFQPWPRRRNGQSSKT